MGERKSRKVVELFFCLGSGFALLLTAGNNKHGILCGTRAAREMHSPVPGIVEGGENVF